MKSFVGQHWRQYVIAVVANFASLNSGYSGAWFSPVEAKLENPNESPLPEPIDRIQAAWMGSLVAVGGIFGPLIAGPAASYVGRKWGIMLGAVPLFLGWLLIAAATNAYMIYAGRLFFGLALGISCTMTPMYCGEIASNEARGALGSIMSIMIVAGMLISFSVGPYVSYSATAYVGVGLASVFAICVYLLPESPFYFLTVGDRESAQESLAMIRGKSHFGVEEELNKMAVEVKIATAQKAKLSDLWATRGNIKALCICCGLLGLQPYTGVSAVQMYTENIFRAAGMDLDASIAAIIFAAVQVIGSFITPFIVDRMGRRVLLMSSALGMVVTLSIFGLYFLMEHNGNPIVSSISFLPVVVLAAYTIIYSFGFGPVPWALVGEVLPINIRPLAGPIVTTLHWTMSFIVARYFYSVVDSLGMHFAFWIFAGASFVGFLFSFFFVPETKGKSFQEIQDILNGRKLPHRNHESSKEESKSP